MEWHGEWPQFPRRVANFIETGNVEYSYRVDQETFFAPIFEESDKYEWWEIALIAGCALAIFTCFVLVILGIIEW